MELDRILLIDKPKGWTSFDVVAKIRGQMQNEYKEALRQDPGLCACDECRAEAQSRVSLTGVKRTSTKASNAAITQESTGNDLIHSDYPRRRHKIRVGHCGTLDPMATGLLVIVTGKNTKRAQEFTKLGKTYEVEMTLGATSDTGDGEGVVVLTEDATTKIKDVNEKKLKEVITGFLGEISQTPPAYSAIKINGQRAYKLAREGKEVKMEPRLVTIYDIKDMALNKDKITFTTDVSSGTYIRSLVQDIGEALGAGAYMSALRRTRIGDFDIKDAITIEEFINQNA